MTLSCIRQRNREAKARQRRREGIPERSARPLCGVSGPQVRPRMVEWQEPIGSRRFEVIPACHDVPECKQRVIQLGEDWPLVPVSNDRGAA